MSSSLYEALGSVESQLSQIKLAIAQEEDEVKSLRDTLVQVKQQNVTLTQNILKIELEVQIGESKASGAKVTKSSLKNEVEELKISLKELLERKEHVKRQLDRLRNYRIQKRKDYQELSARFKEQYLQIPVIAEYEKINSVFSSTRDALEEKRAISTKLKDELMALQNSNANDWKSFVEICIRTAETYGKAQEMNSFLKAGLKERDELKKRYDNRNMSLDERLTQFRKTYNLEQRSSQPNSVVGSNTRMMPAAKSTFQVPNARSFKNLRSPTATVPEKNKLSEFGAFLSRSKNTSLLEDIMARSTEVTREPRIVTKFGSPTIGTENTEQGNKENPCPANDSSNLTLAAKPDDASLMPPPPVPAPKPVGIMDSDSDTVLSKKRKEVDCHTKAKQLRTDEDDSFCVSRSAAPFGEMSTSLDIFGGNSMGLNLFGESSDGNTELSGTESVFSFFQSSGSLF